ncbi:cadherin-like beta sandwich domain-containing protein, partial [Paenibacillus sepulcri]|nr:cadherin-like beta sandwich domain-containing protein [Paenibacillus sepulcri]
MAINGSEPAEVTSGTPSAPLPLAAGDNRIEITVTSKDGLLKQTYEITIAKPAIIVQEGYAGYAGTADTQLSEGVGGQGNQYFNYNLGAQDKYEIGYYNQNVADRKYGLVRFDNLPVPAGAIVTEATLNLYYYGTRTGSSVTDPKTLYVHPAT